MASGKKLCLAVCRESFNVWERRTPLAPCHVKSLVEAGVRVLVQPSGRRCNDAQEYATAGAEITEDMSAADVIVGVKSIDVPEILAEKTYLIYSHTIKGQHENMAMLDEMIRKKVTLVDYELLVDERGLPLGMSSRWAGRAGMLDILHGLGLRLLAFGFNTPLMDVALPHNYPSYEEALAVLSRAGQRIAASGLPEQISPFVFVFTGTGRVSQGAQDVFKLLPHEFITVAQLPEIAKNGARNKFYGVVVDRGDHLMHEDGTPVTDDYDLKSWYEDKTVRLKSSFAEKIAPYMTVLVNGITWATHHPRLIDYAHAKELLRPKGEPVFRQHVPHKLLAIADVSADVDGGVQFSTKCTSIDRPFYIYDAVANNTTEELSHPHGCLMCTVENMPTQVAKEASKDFGDILMPFLEQLMKCDARKPFDTWQADVPRVRDAIIAANGALRPNFAYIERLRNEAAKQ